MICKECKRKVSILINGKCQICTSRGASGGFASPYICDGLVLSTQLSPEDTSKIGTMMLRHANELRVAAAEAESMRERIRSLEDRLETVKAADVAFGAGRDADGMRCLEIALEDWRRTT